MSANQCCTPAPPTHDYVITRGNEELWDHLPVYVSTPLSDTRSALVLVSEVFGWQAPLLRKLADDIARAGIFVVVPDLLYGDPHDGTSRETLLEWLERHSPHEKPREDSKKIIKILKAKGLDAIAFAGFCWGAKVSILVAKEGNINSVVLLHPSFVTVQDIKDITSNSKVPVAVLAAELDHMTPLSVIEEMKATLDACKDIRSSVKVYKGVAHGWTIRYDITDKAATQNAEESHLDLLEWVKRSLKPRVE